MRQIVSGFLALFQNFFAKIYHCRRLHKYVQAGIAYHNSDRQVYDLSNFKQTCISVDELDLKYEQWIEVTERENSINEYGMIMGAVALINNNLDKRHLSLITERRKHW